MEIMQKGMAMSGRVARGFAVLACFLLFSTLLRAEELASVVSPEIAEYLSSYMPFGMRLDTRVSLWEKDINNDGHKDLIITSNAEGAKAGRAGRDYHVALWFPDQKRFKNIIEFPTYENPVLAELSGHKYPCLKSRIGSAGEFMSTYYCPNDIQWKEIKGIDVAKECIPPMCTEDYDTKILSDVEINELAIFVSSSQERGFNGVVLTMVISPESVALKAWIDKIDKEKSEEDFLQDKYVDPTPVIANRSEMIHAIYGWPDKDVFIGFYDFNSSGLIDEGSEKFSDLMEASGLAKSSQPIEHDPPVGPDDVVEDGAPAHVEEGNADQEMAGENKTELVWAAFAVLGVLVLAVIAILYRRRKAG